MIFFVFVCGELGVNSLPALPDTPGPPYTGPPRYPILCRCHRVPIAHAYCWRFKRRVGRTIVRVAGRYQTKEKAASGGLLHFVVLATSGAMRRAAH